MENTSPMKRLWQLSAAEHGRLRTAIALAALGVLAGIVPYWAAAEMITLLLSGASESRTCLILCLAAFVGYALRSILYAEALALSHRAAFAVLRDIRTRVLEKLPPDVEKPDLDNFKLWRPVPSEDAPFGYKGRVVIMEQLVVTDEIQKFIRGDVQDVHPETIEETARNEGMLTLEQVGVLAALRGETTLEEIARVI